MAAHEQRCWDQFGYIPGDADERPIDTLEWTKHNYLLSAGIDGQITQYDINTCMVSHDSESSQTIFWRFCLTFFFSPEPLSILVLVPFGVCDTIHSLTLLPLAERTELFVFMTSSKLVIPWSHASSTPSLLSGKSLEFCRFFGTHAERYLPPSF